MKAKLFTAVTLGAMVATAGSAFAMSLQNQYAHDGGPRSFNRTVSGGQNLVLPFAAIDSQIEVTKPVIGPNRVVNGKSRGWSLQNERAHDGSR